MTITKEQWTKIDAVYPTNDGTDWDGVSDPTVLTILQHIQQIEDVRVALRQYNKNFDSPKLLKKLQDTVGNQY